MPSNSLLLQLKVETAVRTWAFYMTLMNEQAIC